MMGFSKNAVLLFYYIFNYHSERTLHCCFCQFIWVVYSKNPFHDSVYCTHCDSDSRAVDMYSKAMICNPMQVILQGFQCSSYYYFFIYLIFNTITCYSILPDKLAFILLLCSFQQVHVTFHFLLKVESWKVFRKFALLHLIESMSWHRSS